MLCAVFAPTSYSISCPKTPSQQKPLASTRLRVSASLPVPEPNVVVPPKYPPWLIAGLGNPGTKYIGTRHNVGFELIDRISQDCGIALNTLQYEALIGIGSIGEVPVILAKPQSYMSYCGRPVGALAAYYQVPSRHILLAYDEMSLSNGVMKLQPKGGRRGGYHNGVMNVIKHLDDRHTFPRCCIGIGAPPGTMDMKAYVLQKFTYTERKQVDAAIEEGVEGIRTLVVEGFGSKITQFNLAQKYKYYKV